MNLAKFERCQYGIEIRSGLVTHGKEIVLGWISKRNPALGIHKKTTGYAIDHIPSGGVIAEVLTESMAIGLVDAIESENWNWLPEEAGEQEKAQIRRIPTIILSLVKE